MVQTQHNANGRSNTYNALNKSIYGNKVNVMIDGDCASESLCCYLPGLRYRKQNGLTPQGIGFMLGIERNTLRRNFQKKQCKNKI